jgi:biopolymer transport protein TolQ
LRTLGCLALALLLHAQGTSAPEAGTGELVRLFARTGPVAQAVLLILALFSVSSWGVILYKVWAFRRAGRQSARFLNVFRHSAKFSEVQAVCRSLETSPLVGIFQSGYAEITNQLRQAVPTGDPAATSPAVAAARPTIKSVQALDRALLRAASVELNKLERRVTFLATTASITPFIGLFGTVWGIMKSFEAIAGMSSTNIAVVAPGIAEALVNTAAGLFAAIPALYFYNMFASRVKLFAAEMDDFSLEFLNIAEHNFT